MFLLTDEQLALKKQVRAFVNEEICPVVKELDQTEEFPKEIMKRIREFGLCTLPFSKDLGGQEKTMIDAVIFLEELSRGMTSLGAIMNVQMFQCCYPLRNKVSDAQKNEWLMPAIAGKKILAFALGEESCGSDAFNISAIATRTANGWILNGSKHWITNAGVADGYIVAAKTNLGDRSKNVSLFYVDAQCEGVKDGYREKLIGFHNSPTGRVDFVNCLLPFDALIGNENEGYHIIKEALNLGRLAAAAMSIGTAQAALECAVAYSRERGHYDRTISSYQGVSFPIAEMYTNIVTARNMMYHVAGRAQEGLHITMEVAALKLSASEMCKKICDDTMQIFAGAGCSMESEVQRLVRDSRLLTIVNGTSQICKVVISNALFASPDNVSQ